MNGTSMWRKQASVYQLKHVPFSLSWISSHYRWYRHNITADLYFCKLHLTDWPLTNVQTFCKCTFLNITECTSCGGYRDLSSPRRFCVIYTVIRALFVLASVSRCWSLSHTQGEVGHLPGSPAAALKTASLAPGQGAAGPSTLTLLDSIMPVLAWNLTVFNLARSFFSTLGGKKEGEISLGWAWMVVVALALSGISTLQIKSECTFSCSEWPRSAHSLHVAWPTSPATTRRQKHLWHGGYPHKRSSGLGWAGSCPSFDHSQTKLCKNKRLWLHFFPFILNLCVVIPHAPPRSNYSVSTLGTKWQLCISCITLLVFVTFSNTVLHIACRWAVTWLLLSSVCGN